MREILLALLFAATGCRTEHLKYNLGAPGAMWPQDPPEGGRWRAIYLSPKFNELIVIFNDGRRVVITREELEARAK